MQFTTEQIEKARSCKTLEELKELSVKEGLILTEEELKEIFDLTRNGELNDDELSAVAGGTKYSSGVDGPNGFHKYVIVTAFNKGGYRCWDANLYNWSKLDPNCLARYCVECKHMFSKSPTLYCGVRWEGNDKLNKK